MYSILHTYMYLHQITLFTHTYNNSVIDSVRIVQNEVGWSEIWRLTSVNFEAKRGSARLYLGSGGFAASGVQGQSPWSGGLGTKSPRS